MKPFQLKMWQHGSLLMLGMTLAGCGGGGANPSQVTPPNSTVTNVPGAPQQMPGMPNGAGTPAPGGANQPNAQMAAMMKQHGGQPSGSPTPNAGGAGTTPNDKMAAMMKQHGAPTPAAGSGSGSGTPSTTPTNEQMAAMMKQHGAPKPAEGGTPTTPTNEQMAAMMKQYGSKPADGGGATPVVPNDKMAAMMKQHGAPGQGGGAGAGNNSGTTPTNEQMAAMMRQNGGRGGPGAPNGAPNPGTMGGRGGPPGAGGGQSFAAGSTDEALFKFCTAMAEGDTAAASEFISPKAKGILGDLRDGKLSDEKIEEMTNVISPVSELVPNPDGASNTKRSLRNGRNQAMSFTLKKEKDAYKITEFTYPKTKK